MTQPPVLTFALQKQFWALLREFGESSADVAVQHVRQDERASRRATKRHEKARAELTQFVESITEKPRGVKP